MAQPLQAHSPVEVHYYLLVTPCPACGRGPWSVVPASARPGQTVDVAATCQACGQAQTFHFTHSPAAPEDGPESAAVVNPTDAPSRIIDVGQWLSLFYLFIERASAATDKPIARRLGYQAAQCLSEALKFYRPGEELPPPEALFTETSQAAFRDHPDRFARQRLGDMRSRLPALQTMARRIADDRTHAATARSAVERIRRPWWRVLLQRRKGHGPPQE